MPLHTDLLKQVFARSLTELDLIELDIANLEARSAQEPSELTHQVMNELKAVRVKLYTVHHILALGLPFGTLSEWRREHE